MTLIDHSEDDDFFDYEEGLSPFEGRVLWIMRQDGRTRTGGRFTANSVLMLLLNPSVRADDRLLSDVVVVKAVLTKLVQVGALRFEAASARGYYDYYVLTSLLERIASVSQEPPPS